MMPELWPGCTVDPKSVITHSTSKQLTWPNYLHHPIIFFFFCNKISNWTFSSCKRLWGTTVMAVVGPLSFVMLLIFLSWFMQLPGPCYLLWPIFTFVSPINHLTVQSWGLSVAECRINSPLMHKKVPSVVTVQHRIKGNMNHMWQEPWPVWNVNPPLYQGPNW